MELGCLEVKKGLGCYGARLVGLEHIYMVLSGKTATRFTNDRIETIVRKMFPQREFQLFIERL